MRGHAPFVLLNRLGNPLVGALLRSPLHAPLSRRLALITVTGRRSGWRYTFPVGYRRDGDLVTIRVGAPERKLWWRNLLGGGEVGVKIAGRPYRATAQVVGNERSGVSVRLQLGPG